jgi:hypothetical protein
MKSLLGVFWFAMKKKNTQGGTQKVKKRIVRIESKFQKKLHFPSRVETIDPVCQVIRDERAGKDPP